MSSVVTGSAAPGVNFGSGRMGTPERSTWTGAEGRVRSGEGGADEGPDAGDEPRHPAVMRAHPRTRQTCDRGLYCKSVPILVKPRQPRLSRPSPAAKGIGPS